jgi:hypothetical protein
MPTVTGDDLIIEVQDPAAPTTWVPVNDMNRFSRRTTRSTGRTRVFMRSRAYLTRGQREFTATVSGFLNAVDPGQVILRTAMNTDVPVTLRILPDGVNGFTQQFYVGNQSFDANPDPQAMQETGWELSDAADPVAVLLGPIL